MYQYLGEDFYKSKILLTLPGQYAKIEKVKSVKLDNVDAQEKTATCKTYDVSLDDCTCRDFTMKSLPCKHMYALAAELGLINQYASKIDAQKEAFETAINLLPPDEKTLLVKILQEFASTKYKMILFDLPDVPQKAKELGLIESVKFTHSLSKDGYELIIPNEYIESRIDECINTLSK